LVNCGEADRGANHTLAKGASVAPFETLAWNAGLLKLTGTLRVHLTPSGREWEQTSSIRDKSNSTASTLLSFAELEKKVDRIARNLRAT
jgi:hypothetical protein